MSTTEESIMILNNTSNIDFLNSMSPNTKIITLDFESHILLLKKNIEHEISDKYIDEIHIKKIQEESYRLSSWYLENKIKNILEYDGINIGELFYNELYNKLVSILWNLTNLEKIIEKYPNSKFVVPLKLESYIKIFTTSYKLLDEEISNNDNFDSEYELSLNLFSFKIPIKLKKRKIQQIKIIFEIISRCILNTKIQSDKKPILIINFSTLRWKNMMLGLSDKFQFVKHDPILPSIWNLKSFLIIKKSKTIIANILNHSFFKTRNQINLDILDTENKHQQIFENNEFFHSFFQFGNTSFWHILKTYFEQTTKNKIYEMIQCQKFLTHIFCKYDFNYIFIFNELELPEILSIKMAKKYKIPVILFQHGLYSLNDSVHHNFARLLGHYSDYLVVWGSKMKNFATQNTPNKTKIVEIGSLFYDDWLNIPKNNDGYVLITPISPENEIPQCNLSDFKEKYLNVIRLICQNVSEFNKKIIIKLHHDQYCFEDMAVDNLNADIKIIRGGELKPLLEKCDLLITVGLTTAILEASLLHKPAIFVPRTNESYENIFDEFAEIVITPEKLKDFLNKFYHNDEYKSKIIETGKLFLNENISNQGNSSDLLNKFLNNLSK